jgi:Ca2+:H+ antiporter
MSAQSESAKRSISQPVFFAFPTVLARVISVWAGPYDNLRIGKGVMLSVLRSEMPFLAGAATYLVLQTVGSDWMADMGHPIVTPVLFVWIFAVMVWGAFAVVRHADALAEILGEPLGTLVLTLSVVGIEVSLITAVMLTGDGAPTLARDTMFAVLMIVLNGMIGAALLVGGFRHREQTLNLQGAQAFLAVLVPLSVVILILPSFTISTPDPTLSPLQAVLFAAFTLVLYAVFLAIQTVRHRSYFIQPGLDTTAESRAYAIDRGRPSKTGTIAYHGAFLVLTLLPIVLLSKDLAALVDFGIDSLGAPAALGGVLIALLILSPEAMAALKAARANHLQRSVNICLGASLSTIGMTVPAVLAISLITGRDLLLGLAPVDMLMLVLTLLVCTMTFGGARTNMLQGAVHVVLFMVFVVLTIAP